MQSFCKQNLGQLCEKRPTLLKDRVVLLHDNTTPHKYKEATSLIRAYDWEILRHPPYSPDLSPCDYDFFPKLKMLLRGQRFDYLDELKNAVAKELRLITTGCLATGISGLTTRWNVVIEWRGITLKVSEKVCLYQLWFVYSKTIVRTYWMSLV